MSKSSPINITSRSSGFFSLSVLRDGEKKRVAEFPNLITNSGLLRMGSNSDYLLAVSVGSGSAKPEPTDTQLQNLIASTQGTNSTTGARSTPPYYAYEVRQWTFEVGEAAGNISEIGVGWAAQGGGLFSRALVLDSMGDPTTITILPDEQLQVTYEHRYYPPEADVTGEFTLSGNIGGTYSFVGRAANVNSADSLVGWSAGRSQSAVGVNDSIGAGASNGVIGDVTDSITGTRRNGTRPSQGTGTGLTRNFKLTWGVDQGNISGGLSAFALIMGNGMYQFQVSPPIKKTNEDILELIFSHSWGRRE